ncbi:MAG: coproporphyrinogen dehydrogenase HemZ [Clostridiales bacterium]|nr:coproporphyrinogen dehydrogenase HemZ [Clostridiales bacterium]HOK81401.1 coproporphyrinogen dehydrogenase HemZ [Clostridia bacterium]HOL60701.1 coproporphyrinogen dehydrogenase HemZ [Clostridia bacterium]HPO53276.1 coproporphyrinogen dehydrogenase HemZ [Clostridia bacterium]
MFVFRWEASLPPYLNDAPEIVRAYNPYIKLDPEAEEAFCLKTEQGAQEFVCEISAKNKAERRALAIKYAEGLEYKKLTKRFVKTCLYDFCKALTGISLPYGSLTGVRPTKLYYELMKGCPDPKEALIDTFFVEPERARLIADVVENQAGIYELNPKNAGVFVNIPFCPTRCKYCSFISTEIGRARKKIDDYIEAVRAELNEIIQKIDREGLKVRSIYVGGGTPTSLEARELYDILYPVANKNYGVEFTVEAGRPDSITGEKLAVLSDLGATRISINPQTFNQKTLREIGRAHTPEQIIEAYSLSRQFNFDINMDLIAGLPGESFDDFSASLEKTISLAPENITVHTLAIKRGAVFRNDGLEKNVGGEVKKCVDFARERLKEAGYGPYYMYRQKNMADNLENVGYCLPNKQCVYNIDYMEEICTIYSAGAAGMTKLVFHDQNRIERVPNAKGLDDYLKQRGFLYNN